ncbi:hypothetical protein L9F63_005720 [Diploptera punctata]|uniref:FH2 domain-containing protein n=1 Tax=Diploptera punctata TaxID=6984 RepID=A0AAD7ZCL9_DIPPU|nr:hypothetical protein L9F63_005720 [Diploptera punctata]
MDTQANKPNMTFLHYVVEVTMTQNKECLAFTNQLSDVTTVSRISVDNVESEVKKLSADVKRLRAQLLQDTDNIASHFSGFVDDAVMKVDDLAQKIFNCKKVTTRLAQYFCEDPNKFQPEECFSLLADFFLKVKKAVKENEERQKREEKAAQRATNPGKKNPKPVPGAQELTLVEMLMKEISTGGFKLRRNVG